MSLLETVLLWVLLALGVGIAAAVAAGVGYCYGRLARGWSDESAARGLNVVSFSAAAIAALGTWLVLPSAGTESAFGPDHAAFASVVVAVASSLAAGAVGAAAVTGITRARPDLPGADDGAALRRQYGRYFAGVFLVVLLLVPGIELAVRTGPLGIGVSVLLVGTVIWICGPLLRSLTASTRSPTDAERDRLDRLCERSGLEVRTVRVLEGNENQITIELLGAPGGRVLFVSGKALEAFDDETLATLFIANRERTASAERFAVIVVLAVAMVPLSAWILGDLPATVGLAATGTSVLGGFAVVRRLRLRADDRAAEEVSAASLAETFERACEAAGFDLSQMEPGRRWLSPTPSIATRIERLREAADASRRSR